MVHDTKTVQIEMGNGVTYQLTVTDWDHTESGEPGERQVMLDKLNSDGETQAIFEVSEEL